MHQYNLGFVPDDDIYEHVRRTVLTYRREITLSQFDENIVDPIKLTFDSGVYGKSIAQVISDECFRQIDRSNANKIDYFHKSLFKLAGNGWNVPAKGFDVENVGKHIFVEIRSRYDTMNAASSRKTYMRMQAKLLDDDQATCYLVEVISKRSKNETWKLTLDGRPCAHRRIRRMSMDKFYELVFGDTTAFYRLCMALPAIVADVVSDNEGLTLRNTVYEELIEAHPDLLTSMYMLAFSTYDGFEQFEGKQNG